MRDRYLTDLKAFAAKLAGALASLAACPLAYRHQAPMGSCAVSLAQSCRSRTLRVPKYVRVVREHEVQLKVAYY